MPCCYEPKGTMIISFVRKLDQDVLDIRLFPGDGPDEAYAKLANQIPSVPAKGLPKPMDMEYGYCLWKKKYVIKRTENCVLVPFSKQELIQFINSIEPLSLYWSH